MFLLFVATVVSKPRWYDNEDEYNVAANDHFYFAHREPQNAATKKVFRMFKRVWSEVGLRPKDETYKWAKCLTRALAVVLQSEEGGIAGIGELMLSGYVWATAKFASRFLKRDPNMPDLEHTVARKMYDVLYDGGLHERLMECASGLCNELTFRTIDNLELIPPGGKWDREKNRAGFLDRFGCLWNRKNGMFMQFVSSLGGANNNVELFSSVENQGDMFTFLMKLAAYTFTKRWNKVWTKRLCGRFCNRVRYVNRRGYVTRNEVADAKSWSESQMPIVTRKTERSGTFSLSGGERRSTRKIDQSGTISLPEREPGSTGKTCKCGKLVEGNKFEAVVFGPTAVGKTMIVDTMLGLDFVEEYEKTYGFTLQDVTVSEKGRDLDLKVWDVGGRLIDRYADNVKGKDLVFLVYDITDRNSFSGLQKFGEIARQKCGDVPVIVLGNKVDLEDSRAVSAEEGIKFAQDFGAQAFFETNAKDYDSVSKAFQAAAKLLIKCIKQ